MAESELQVGAGDAQALDELAGAAHAALLGAGLTVGLAESLTGGMIAEALSRRSGASAILRGGFVVYATDLKHSLAGVSQQLLAERGAVDPDVAQALALGARTRLGASLGIGITGVAGPLPQDGKSVGTVFLASSRPRSSTVHELSLSGTRQEIRVAASCAALALVLRESSPSLGS